MANTTNLSNSTPNFKSDKDLIVQWSTVINILKKYHIVTTKQISNVMAKKYKHDLYGLFQELQYPAEFIYPLMRVNGYMSSREYNGDVVIFDIVDATQLDTYLTLFNRK